MSFFAQVGNFSWPTSVAGTPIPVTGLPGPPKAVILWTASRDAAGDDVGRETDGIMSAGLAISPTTRFGVAARSNDAGTSTSTDRATANDAVLIELGLVTNIAGLLDVDSFDATGFTLIIDDAITVAKRVHWLAIGGTDISVAAGAATVPGTTGLQTVSGLGIDPDFVMTLTPGAFLSFGAAAAAVQGGMSLGFASAATATNQFTAGGISRDEQGTSTTGSYGRSGECASFVQLSGGVPTVVGRGTLDSFGTGEFVIDWLEVTGGTSQYAYLAIEGGQQRVGTFLSRTSLTTFTEPASPWSPAFTPEAAFFLSHCQAESTVDTTQADHALSIGAADGTAQGAQSYIDVDGLATTEVTTAVDLDSIYANLVTDALEGTIALTSFGSGQLNLDQTDADTAQAVVGYWAVGPTAAGGAIDNDQLAMMGFAASAGGRLPWMW